MYHVVTENFQDIAQGGRLRTDYTVTSKPSLFLVAAVLS